MPAKGSGTAKPETQAQLARKLGVTANSISAWRKLPGAPAMWDFVEWKAFMEANGLGIRGAKKIGGERENLLTRKLSRETELLDLKIAKEKGQMVDKGAVNEFLLHIATLLKTTLRQRLGRELGARAEGKSAAELNALGEQITDELCQRFAEGLDQFKGQ